MSESVIADFFGSFHAPNTPAEKPVRGRIVCSGRRLVLAANSESTVQIPLAAVVDVGVGTVPPDLAEFFDSTVTIAYERGDRQLVAAVEADTDDIRKFSTVLFGAILTGTEVSIRHPTAVDGRLTDEPFRSADVGIARHTVTFQSGGESVGLGLGDVIGFDRSTAEIDGTERPVVEVVSIVDGRAVTTHIGGATPRWLSLLGRYLRLEYAEAAADARDLDLDEPATRALLTSYAAGDSGVVLTEVLEEDDGVAETLRADLAAAGLLAGEESGSRLTRLGRIAAEAVAGDVA